VEISRKLPVQSSNILLTHTKQTKMLVQTIADSKQTIGFSGYLSLESEIYYEKTLLKEDFNLSSTSVEKLQNTTKYRTLLKNTAKKNNHYAKTILHTPRIFTNNFF
jgi:ADP-dependent phosphofructokinase/glucokinase